jgi:hypothetical protein
MIFLVLDFQLQFFCSSSFLSLIFYIIRVRVQQESSCECLLAAWLLCFFPVILIASPMMQKTDKNKMG